jgi:glyoxylase-like metal-dependent hydrolase (beta-lactamase superfamily II)
MFERAPRLLCQILDTGYCLAHESHLLRGGARRTIACHSIAALLRHPRHGWLLWDTGYAPRMLEATRRWPFSLYRRATPLHIRPELAVVAQLERFGLQPADIKTIIVSHFHADHIAGLHDFPAARFVATRAAFDDTRQRQGWNALRRAFIPALLPADFADRADLLPAFDGPALPGLGATHDLLHDGSLLLVALPGHARGQIGLLAQTERGPVLFAADGCWHSRSIRERRPPHPLTYLFVDDRRAVQTTIDALHHFAAARPDVRIVPSHCPEAFARELGP